MPPVGNHLHPCRANGTPRIIESTVYSDSNHNRRVDLTDRVIKFESYYHCKNGQATFLFDQIIGGESLASYLKASGKERSPTELFKSLSPLNIPGNFVLGSIWNYLYTQEKIWEGQRDALLFPHITI